MQIFERERPLPGRTPRRVVVGSALAALASLALMAAGCGGGSAGPSVAQAPSGTTTTQPSQSDGSQNGGSGNAAAYSACMRSHGVPKYPDPDSDGRILLKAGPGSGIDPESPQFKAAAEACRKLAPPEGQPPSPAQQAKDREQMLKFAACMRSHGLPNFPDPVVSGGGISLSLKNTGLNPESLQFKTAEKACEKLLPGSPGSNSESGGKP